MICRLTKFLRVEIKKRADITEDHTHKLGENGNIGDVPRKDRQRIVVQNESQE